MTENQHQAGSRAGKLIMWLLAILGLVIALVIAGIVGFFLNLESKVDQGNQEAGDDARRSARKAVDRLRAGLADGTLADSEIETALSESASTAYDVVRHGDRIVISASTHGQAGGPFVGGSSTRVCSVYEITQPLGPSSTVTQRELASCAAMSRYWTPSPTPTSHPT